MNDKEKEIALRVATELESEGFSGAGMDYTWAFSSRFLDEIRKSAGPVAWKDKTYGNLHHWHQGQPEHCTPLYLYPAPQTDLQENAVVLDQIVRQQEEIESLRAECEEQARLMGMSGSREAKLLAELEAVKREIEKLEERCK